MEGKKTNIVLLSIIAVLSLALAVLIIFLFILYPNQKQQSDKIIDSDDFISERVVADDEMIEFKLFDGEDKLLALKDEPNHPDSIVLVKVSIKCDTGPKRKNEEKVTNLVSLYTSDLEQAVGDYFAAMTYTEAKDVETRYKARDELMEIFNNILNENKNAKQKIVYKVNLEMLPQ